ncbi:MAG: ABC transporter permease subunit [Thermonemataceae bacterium]|nr:ABC transporter permease subunit [Thermonemataceae bacterium]
MKRLVSIEFQKIWKSKASRVLTLAYFVLLSLLSLIASINFNIGPIHIKLAEQGIFEFPYIWHFNTYFTAIFKLFLAVVIVSMVANEYSYGTLKQNLIDGMSKKEFILSKFLMVVLFALASTIFVFFVSFVLGISFSHSTSLGSIFSELEYLLAFFVKLIGFFSFCLFLGVLIKKSAFALGVLFLWFLFENISYAILRYQFFNEATEMHQNLDNFYNLFPLRAMSNLIVEPISRLSFIKNISQQVGVANLKDYAVHWYVLLIVLCWTFIFVYSSWRILKKRDL